MTDAKAKEKTCFVIGPIGAPGSPERTAADWLLIEVIRRVLEGDEFKYRVVRADQLPEPGMITDQVITLASDAELVIADLTGHNANAFYELAIRHMGERPVIHMAKHGEAIPIRHQGLSCHRLQARSSEGPGGSEGGVGEASPRGGSSGL